ncbi:proton-conducting transporter transmembrane domain-containing protein [Sessilibacter sp. MAH4]
MNNVLILLIFAPAFSLVLQLLRFFAIKNISAAGVQAEKTTYYLVMLPILACLLGVLVLSINVILHGPSSHHISNWFGSSDYDYKIIFVIDYLSIVYGLLSLTLLGTICYFSKRYLHKDPGFHRFYLLFTIFCCGLLIVAFAGILEILIIGWELVGISSVLLIAFYTTRDGPPRNALYVFIIYRCCDIGLITAALLLHYFTHHSNFELLENSYWYGIEAPHDGLLIIGLCILFAASGKAALFPFSSWIPRAMEGPTPSSAIFYGALSVHLGPLLLLRSINFFAESQLLMTLLLVIGVLTALIGFLSWQVQNDIKSKLAYGSVTQLGIIVCEIALGWEILALIHVVTHASLRALQILRAPSLLQDYKLINQMLGHSLAATREYDHKVSRFRQFIYRISLERGLLETFWKDRFLGTLKIIILSFDRLDNNIAAKLGNAATDNKNTVKGDEA